MDLGVRTTLSQTAHPPSLGLPAKVGNSSDDLSDGNRLFGCQTPNKQRADQMIGSLLRKIGRENWT